MGIVEPRVVVKFSRTKLTSPSTKSSQQEDENVTKSSRQKKTKDKKYNKKKNKKTTKPKVIKLSHQNQPPQNNIFSFHDGILSDFNDYQMYKIADINSTPSKLDRPTRNKASSDAIRTIKPPSSFSHNNITLFGGYPTFNNELEDVNISNNFGTSYTNKIGSLIRNNHENGNAVNNHIANVRQRENKFPDSKFNVVNRTESENSTTEARCILTMQDEGKQHRITQSSNMICQSKQQAENINNTSSRNIPNAHINYLKENNYKFNYKVNASFNDEDDEISIKSYSDIRKNEKVKIKPFVMQLRNELQDEMILKAQNMNL